MDKLLDQVFMRELKIQKEFLVGEAGVNFLSQMEQLQLVQEMFKKTNGLNKSQLTYLEMKVEIKDGF